MMTPARKLNKRERAELVDQLLAAAQAGDREAIRSLSPPWPELNLALVRAVRLGNLAPVRLLLDLGADPDAGGENASALVHAVGANDEPMATLLLDRGADVDAPGTVDYYTALATACSSGREEMVRFLIARGADVNRRIPAYDQGNRGGSPWELAWNHPNIRRILELAGATPKGHHVGPDALRFRDLDRRRRDQCG